MLAAGFVLVGGQSSRMGQDKARLKIRSHFLVEIVARVLAKVVNSVALVGPPDSFSDLPLECLPDLRPGLGPLSGLETALASARAQFNLVLSCDMPDVQSADLSRLLAVARQTGAPCTLAVDSHGRKHPLCAVYQSTALPHVSAALDANRLRLLDLVEELKAGEVHIDSVLHNLNTPEQWAAWRATQPV